MAEIFEAHGCISRLISREFCAEYSSFSILCGPRAIYLIDVGNSHRLQVLLISVSVCIGIYESISSVILLRGKIVASSKTFRKTEFIIYTIDSFEKLKNNSRSKKIKVHSKKNNKYFSYCIYAYK